MYQIGDYVDIDNNGFLMAVELLSYGADGSYEAIFYPEDKKLRVKKEQIVGKVF